MSTISRLITFAVAITTITVGFVGAANAASERARQALLENPALEYAPDSVIVRFKESVTGSERGQAMRAARAQGARTLMAQARLEQLFLEKGRPVEQALNALSRLPFVEIAEPDYVVRPVTNDSLYGLLYAINNTGQAVNGRTGTPDADMDVVEAWNFTTGDPNLVIAVIDDGVEYTHPDLDDNMWVNPGEVVDGRDNDGNGYVDDIYGYDFFADDADPYDDNNVSTGEGGHGTHVAGTICAEGNNGTGIVGVVQQCQIMALRFLGPGGGYTSDAVRAVQYAANKGVKLSNNSWGGGGYSSALYSAIQSAGNLGHLFLAAAGNDGTNNDATPHYPSNYNLPNVISVAATDNRDQLAGFSNYGTSSVDIAAPGVNIVSSTWGSYYYFNGTSMATPNVTGTAALILSQNPGFGFAEIRERLLSTARPVPGLSGVIGTGGVVNALAALSVAPPVPVPVGPTDLVAAAAGTSTVTLSFSDNADNEDGFNLYRSDAGGNFSRLTTLPANTTAFTDTGLAPNTEYGYEVTAFNTSGESLASNTTYVTTDAEAVIPPASPSDLRAEAPRFDSVQLTFSDNSDNEDGFQVLRAVAGGGLTAVATLAADVTTWSDNQVNAETTYSYQVVAFNAAGDSLASNTVSVTTPAAPTSQQAVAQSEVFVAGTVSGSFVATQTDDGITQRIQEIESGGKPSRRTSYLEHVWRFNLAPATSATFNANVWAEGNESFAFSYSINGGAYQPMFTVDGGNEGNSSSFLLPAGISGTLSVRVVDTDRSQGARTLDTLLVDHLYVEAAFVEVDPPIAPGTPSVVSSVPGEITIGWSDQASDETGYEVERAVAGGAFEVVATLGADSTTYVDSDVASETLYSYRVRAVNVGGYSSYSSVLDVVSEQIVVADINLQAAGYKVKGWQNVDLSWSGANGAVDILRDGSVVATVEGSSYTDGQISKGGAVYAYQVCPTDGGACSDIVTVAF